MKPLAVLPVIICLILISCSRTGLTKKEKETTVYRTENLIITKLSENVYEHTSYLQTESFGKVPCNGMIVLANGEAIVLDTPANVPGSVELLDFAEKHKWKINAVVATHFHEDCVAGIDEFHKRNIPSYANEMTLDLLKNESRNIPQIGFEKEFVLMAGSKKIFLHYFGQGHTKDNIIAYFPDDSVLFGGCLVKEMNAGKGYLGDANEAEWSGTVEKIKAKYPNLKTIIPGHGKRGGKELLDYTIRLFTP